VYRTVCHHFLTLFKSPRATIFSVKQFTLSTPTAEQLSSPVNNDKRFSPSVNNMVARKARCFFFSQGRMHRSVVLLNSSRRTHGKIFSPL
jgi:hypothetical protein